MVAKTFWGLENVLAHELTTLGVSNLKIGNRAVYFEGPLSTLYRVNLWSRTALRILCTVHQFKVKNETDLYNGVSEIDWSNFMDVSETFAVDSVLHTELFNHSHYISLKTKDAIVDQFREKHGIRPSIDLKSPSLRVHIHIDRDHCNLLIDSSGDALYKRGYRQSTGIAPLNEVLAAGLIYLSEWDGNGHFVDPMCGSGTTLCEAALNVCRIAPGLLRDSFGFMRWPNYDPTIWEKLKKEAKLLQRDTPYKFVGSDISPRVLSTAAENIEMAGLDEYISLSQKSFDEKMPPPAVDNSIMMVNPPYGERIKVDNVIDLYKRLGDTLKQNYNGYQAWILSGNKEAVGKVGLRTSKKLTVFNGTIQCKFHGYQLFKGGWKDNTANFTK